jgi:outer membrane protein assembly factor BamB
LSLELTTNDGLSNFNGSLKKSSKYKFSKIKNFYQFEPEVSFNGNNIIFFDNKGSILQFDNRSKLLWKKNYYSKKEKKLNPILQFANDNKYLFVADSIAKYYLLDLSNGNLVWSKNNSAPFNSQIKMYKDKIFVIDFTNTLRCFSLKDGGELWNIKTESSLIRSQKKLSMVILDDIIYFNNSIGDISAVNINKGELLWQLPTQGNLVYESAFSLETSDIIADKNNLFFSNNKNQFFSINVRTGNFNWENKVNSNLRPILIENFLLSVSIEGYLIIIDKITGNIIKVTDVFDNFNPKKRSKIKPTGFIVGLNNIYLSTNIGRLLVIDIKTGKTISTLKIDNETISRPFVSKNNLFLAKDNAIIKLN